LYFTVTNFYVELKPQVMVSRGMNSPAFTLYTTFDFSWTIGKPFGFDKVPLKAEAR